MSPRQSRASYLALTLATSALMSVAAQAATIQIAMDNLEISPAEAAAKVGDTIEWVNRDTFDHTATAQNGDWDVVVPSKKAVRLILKKAGSIDYYCRFHPNMKATLTIASP
jgi:plastocyanin